MKKETDEKQNDLDCLKKLYYARNLEIERLKSELSEQGLLWAGHCNKAYIKGENRGKEEIGRLRKELEDNESSYDKLFNEYKESRKEHEADILKINTDWFGYGDRMKAEGLVVGERRAVKRMKEELRGYTKPEDWSTMCRLIEKWFPVFTEEEEK